jgi:acyl-CoA reductase-like NAD-dependent aldehyde dehydrogenase
MRMYVAGEWVSKPQTIPVENPYDRSVVDTVPRADRGDVERALESAVRGARVMAKLSGYDRFRILRKAADLMIARQEAVTPFNFPLNLVCHKVGPALAGGNAVIVKPATDTPLSALKLTEILLEAGLPAEGIQCLTGPGGELGDLLCGDPRVRKITFTGSRDVGERICRVAGIKRVTMELGSNSPVIVMPDANLDRVAEAVALTGFANAGQVCISAQRVLA